jgi:hypothetical protein
MSILHVTVAATFVTGFLAAFGVTHKVTTKQQQLEQQQHSMCLQLKSHHLQPPKGVKC